MSFRTHVHGRSMKANFDTYRWIILATYDAEGPLSHLPGIPDPVFAAHAKLLVEGGFLEAEMISGVMGEKAVISRLTFAGQEAASMLKDDARWREAKEMSDQMGGWSFARFLQFLER